MPGPSPSPQIAVTQEGRSFQLLMSLPGHLLMKCPREIHLDDLLGRLGGNSQPRKVQAKGVGGGELDSPPTGSPATPPDPSGHLPWPFEAWNILSRRLCVSQGQQIHLSASEHTMIRGLPQAAGSTDPPAHSWGEAHPEPGPTQRLRDLSARKSTRAWEGWTHSRVGCR